MASREWEIDQQLGTLASKIVAQTNTPQEFTAYQHLTAERANLMRPPVARRRRGLCERLRRRLESFS
ncbi:MAG: hypothetical protein RL538_564 [Candidatus Parcubacteria bacterium]|jgi:hypothetical protein